MLLIRTACIIVLLLLPLSAHGRTNSLSAGLSLTYDYNDRQYEPEQAPIDDEDQSAEQSNLQEREDEDDDDYSTIAVIPLLHFLSESAKDHFELRTSPKIKYDLLDSSTDWDNDLKIAASRYLTRKWQVAGSNHFIRSDYQEDAVAENQDTESELSNDPGRERYWRNELNLNSTYHYREESQVTVDLGYTALRNDDDSSTSSYDDYDRYRAGISNEHRYSRDWKTVGRFNYVRGDYHPGTSDAGDDPEENEETFEQQSDDIREYHLLASIVNSTFYHHTISLNYNFIASRYDDELQDDGDIHQGRITWNRIFSPHLSTTLGIGPSYNTYEGREGSWGVNGIAAINYSTKYATYGFTLEKRYDVDNFSGTDERGTIDYWDLRLSYGGQLLRDLRFSAAVSYRYEDREQLELDEDGLIASYREDPETEADDYYYLQDYNKQGLTARLGLRYDISESYSAGINYTFYRQDSEREGENYDDHRLLISLSWKQKLLQW